MKFRSYILLELAVWFTLPLVFLGFYVFRYHHPPIVFLEHLVPVCVLVAFCLIVKLLLRRLLPWRKVADALSTVLYVTTLLALATYYLIVTIGLRSWGKVISEELIVAYASQAREFCETIGLSFTAVVAGLLALWIGLACLHYQLARRIEPAVSVSHIPPRMITLALVCGLVLTLHRFYMFTSASVDGTLEPFQLTLYGGKGPAAVRDHNIAFNPAFDKEENEARKAYLPSAAARRKNVILIVADGLRADHTQPYGYRRNTTPYLQQLLTDSKWEKFDNVHSYCAESNCATVSLLASRDSNRIPSEPVTFAQVLKLHGYTIHMIMGGDQTNYYNKRALFGKVDTYFDGSMAKGYYMSDDNYLLPKANELPEWNGKPTMIQFHIMSTHILGKRLAAYERFQPSQTYAGTVEGAPEERYTNFYDNGVFQFDAFVRQLLDTVGRKKYLDDAIVVITSDHGESLGEKGRFNHGHGVHEPLLHVPLLISGMQARPPSAPGPAPFIAQRDIAPSILQELGIPIPATWTGQSIRALQAAGKNDALSHFEMHDHVGVFDGRDRVHRWKYSVNHHTKEEAVYDLASDPGEKYNLFLQVPAALTDEWRSVTPAPKR